MMILGADEGSEGDKSKVFAMQEGPDEGDITDDDYRFTAELRGANYGAPGTVTYRIICGDGVSRDGGKQAINFNGSRWYFWKFSWQTGSARLDGSAGSGPARTARRAAASATRRVRGPTWSRLQASGSTGRNT